MSTTIRPTLEEWSLGATETPHFQAPAIVSSRSRLAEQSLHTRLAAFAPIALQQMNNVALLDRVESKYVLHMETLLPGLDVLRNDYAVLEIDGRRINHYRTLYFDTEDFALYRRHQAGALNRYKVRSREYVESQLSFLEVKHKTNKKRTVKSRVTTPELVTEISGEPAHFLSDVCPYESETLHPQLWNRYTRMTFVNRHSPERLTIDIGLSFEWEGRTVGLPGIVIVEVKRPAFNAPSPFVSWAQSRHLRSNAFSKYCVGMSLLNPELKANRFKSSHRLIASLLQGDSYVAH